ncbi:MAG TPA: LOG family protein [Thermoanaerobaculia bacterium]|nr:LOG family protein [Thermoanaerobaculia bacterium]
MKNLPRPGADCERLVAVLGSSSSKEGDPSYETAVDLGHEIVRRGGSVLCGGYGGIMEAACRGARDAGGEAVGVILAGGGEPNLWVTQRVVAEDLAERLRRLRDLARAWIFMPRGLGTLLELVWVAESIVKGEALPRPVVLFGPFWKPLVETVLSEATGARREDLLRCLRWASDPQEAARLALPDS